MQVGRQTARKSNLKSLRYGLTLFVLGLGTAFVSPASAQDLGRLEFVGVGGYNSHRIRGYFETTLERLRERGAGGAQAIFPQASLGIEQGADFIAAKATEIHARTGRRLVIVAHSKGGIEALVAAVKHPRLLAFVEKFILVQAAARGSRLADFVLRFDPGAIAAALGAMRSGPIPDYFNDDLSRTGLQSMATARTEELLRRLSGRATRETLEQASANIVYVTSASTEPPDGFPSFSRLLNPMPNDHVIPIVDQSLDRLGEVDPFGVVAGNLSANHYELLAPPPARAGRSAPPPQAIAKMRDFADGLAEIASGRPPAWKASLLPSSSHGFCPRAVVAP